jgi:hypothetical protein
MEQVVPWRELCALIHPVYPNDANASAWQRSSVGIF